jgi:hypothetical protein
MFHDTEFTILNIKYSHYCKKVDTVFGTQLAESVSSEHGKKKDVRFNSKHLS